MYIINKPRGGGKTFELIMDSAKTGVRILSFNKSSAKEIERKANDMKVNIPKPISFDEIDKFPNEEEVLIDELTLTIERLLNKTIVGSTDTVNVIQEDKSNFSEYKMYVEGKLFR